MKKAIFTIMIGSDPSYPFVKKTFEQYAKRVGADLICTTEFNYSKIAQSRGFKQRHCAWLEKIAINQLLEKYDRVLYLDADILIHPHAPDIFATYPDTDNIYMLNEGLYFNREKCIGQILSLLPLNTSWPKNQTNKDPMYYNSGVMLVSKNANLFQHIDIDELLSLCGKVSFYEQTYFNYLMVKFKLNTGELEKNFNRMEVFGTENYLNSHFIHYAGGGYGGHIKFRYRTIIQDYLKLYGETLSKPQQSVLKLKADLSFFSNEVKRNLRKLVK